MRIEAMIPDALERLVVALCADYGRRANVIMTRSAPYNVIMEYRFLNYRLLNAVVEVVGTRDAPEYIDDIARGTGFSATAVPLLSERTYKERKRMAKLNILKRLSLF